MTISVDHGAGLSEHFDSLSYRLPALRAQYQSEHYIEISPFVPPALHQTALRELEDLFDRQSQRRDLIIAMSGNTPRKYRNVDRDTLAEGSKVIPAVYRDPALIGFLEQVVGRPCYRCRSAGAAFSEPVPAGGPESAQVSPVPLSMGQLLGTPVLYGWPLPRPAPRVSLTSSLSRPSCPI